MADITEDMEDHINHFPSDDDDDTVRITDEDEDDSDVDIFDPEAIKNFMTATLVVCYNLYRSIESIKKKIVIKPEAAVSSNEVQINEMEDLSTSFSDLKQNVLITGVIIGGMVLLNLIILIYIVF